MNLKNSALTLLLFLGSLLNADAQAIIDNNNEKIPFYIPGLVNELDGRWFTVKDPITKEEFWLKYKTLLGFSERDSFALVKETDIAGKIKRLTYQQYINGYKVEGAIGFLFLEGEFVKRVHLDFIKEKTFPLQVLIAAGQALQHAKDYLAFEGYSWESALDSNVAGYKVLSVKPKGELVISPKSGKQKFWDSEFRLSWKFLIANNTLDHVNNVYVDVENGQIVNVQAISVSCSPTKGVTARNDTQSISTSYYDSTYGYRLTDNCGGANYSANLVTEEYSSGSYKFYSRVTNDWTSQGPSAEVTSHWAGTMTLKYWGDYWDFDSYNDLGSTLNVYNNKYLFGAFWNGYAIYLGDNGTKGVYDDFNTIDIVGHEFTHAVTQSQAGLLTSKEPGALHESFSDIFGVALEESLYGSGNFNYTIGEERGKPIRSLSSPKSYNNPDTYEGSYWYNVTSCSPDITNNKCGVHTNCGVQNYWFYLLAEGDSGINDHGFSYNLAGLGFQDAIKIVYTNLTGYLTPNSGYSDTRIGSVWAAEILFGNNSKEKDAVEAAWCAVGVGGNCGGGDLTQKTGTSATYNHSGETLQIACYIENEGTSSVDSFRVGYYLSLSSTFSTLDYLIGTDRSSSLKINDYTLFHKTIDLCTKDVPDGTYYAGYFIDYDSTVNELDESNNIFHWNTPIKISCRYIVNLFANPSNRGTVSGGGNFANGKSITVTATPNTGWNFDNWTENGTIVSSSPAYSFNVTASRDLIANFSPRNNLINLSSNPVNGGHVSGGGNFLSGQKVTVTATPNSNWVFSNWTDDGKVISTDTSYSFTVTEDKNLVANFRLQEYLIDLSADPANGGSVSGGGKHSHGQNITVTATPTNGWNFANWTEGSTVVSASSDYSFTANADRNLTAHFTDDGVMKYDIILETSPENSGTVQGGGSYAEGDSAIVIANNTKDWKFSHWLDVTGGFSSFVSIKATYEFVVNSERSLAAVFLPTQPGAIYSDSDEGHLSIYPNPNTGVFTIQLHKEFEGNISINIYDQVGQKVYEFLGEVQGGSFTKEIELNEASGFYYVVLSTSQGITRKKLVLTK